MLGGVLPIVTLSPGSHQERNKDYNHGAKGQRKPMLGA